MANSSMEQVSVKLPPAFDATRHHTALVKLIAQKHGDGFEVQHIDPVLLVAVATRQVAITEMTAATKTKDSFEVRLARGTTMSDGDKVAAKLEDQNAGYYLTGFEPFLGKATLTKMPDAQARCRGAAAVALGVKPWDVQVASRRDDGFDLILPKSYVPSKHDEKLQEVASVIVGQDGWYVDVNTQKLTASIIPSAPPTFPEMLPTPMAGLGADPDRTPIGLKLPRPGKEFGEPISVDWAASAHLFVAGTPGAGKRHPLTTRLPVPISERHPAGWTTVGDLRVGDQVFSGAGDVVHVDYLSPIVDRDVYRLTFQDGQTVDADADHLWNVSDGKSRMAHGPSRTAKRVAADGRRGRQLTRIRGIAQASCAMSLGATSPQLQDLFGISENLVCRVAASAGVPHVVQGGKGSARVYPVDEFAVALSERIIAASTPNLRLPLVKTVTTAQIAGQLITKGGSSNWAVPMAGAIVTPAADLPVPPYTLGAWLGDGSTNSGTLAGIDPEIWEAIEADGYEVTHSKKRAEVHTIHKLVGPLREIGVLGEKHIPEVYLRASIGQRLELLRGLMDTDGTVTVDGRCMFAQSDERLAHQVLELVRSLGIRGHLSSGMGRISEDDPDLPGSRRRRETKLAYRVSFRTDRPVFKLARKADRQTGPGGLSASLGWNRIVDVVKLGRAPGRCLRVNTPSHLYLVEGFIPTHNTVTLNVLIADQLASGASLCVADDVSKAVDFLWCKDFVRDGGWGCDSDRAAVAALALVYAEGQRRAKELGEAGFVNWLDMPKGQRFQPIFVVVDEVSALLVTDKIPSGVPKTHPLVQEMLESNLMKVQLASYISKLVAEMRFVGIRMVLSTQVANNNTGVPPSLKAKIGGRLLAGTNPSKSARVQTFPDEAAVPTVPENVKAGGKRARGVGAADLDGQAPVVYKSFFASTQEYRAHLERLGVPKTTQPAPTAVQIAKYTPSLDDDGSDDDGPPSRFDGGGFGAPDGRDDQGGPRLMGAAKAAHQLKVDAAAHAKAQAQDRVSADIRAALEDR